MVSAAGGLELKIMRLKAGLKQYELAAKLGLSPVHLSEIETGRREVLPELYRKIAETLGNSINPLNSNDMNRGGKGER